MKHNCNWIKVIHVDTEYLSKMFTDNTFIFIILPKYLSCIAIAACSDYSIIKLFNGYVWALTVLEKDHGLV